jgi:acetoin utilization protein AcuB
MVVRDIMTTEVVSVEETDTLLDAAMIFARSTLRHLPVLKNKKVVGIITQRDLRSFAPGLLSGVTSEQYQKVMETTSIARVMARNIHTVRPEQPVVEAVDLLYSNRVGCLPVVENEELAGIVTTTDMLGLMVRMLKEKKSAGAETGRAS